MMRKSSVKLETERLILRSLEMADAPTIHLLVNEREIALNTLLIPYPYPPGAAEEWIQSTLERDLADGCSLAITDKHSGQFMGAIGLSITREHYKAEIGYWLGKPYWNQGYVSEAARRLIQFGFEEMGLNRIYAAHFMRNPASGRVMQKAGMTFEAVLRHHYCKWGEFQDCAMYSILRSDYEAIKD
jgi:RimJ/RimL family protein N-acetyltransferase